MTTIASPLTVRGVTLPNRTVMAPMTRRSANPQTFAATPELAAYYARRAAGGIGMIVTEGVHVNGTTTADGSAATRCRTEEQIAGWKGVVDACKAANPNVVMSMQLWHIGVWSNDPVAPSEAPTPGGINIKTITDDASQRLKANPSIPPVAREATPEDLENILNDFVETAVNAVVKCGFDSVQIHGAHGYFLDAFTSEFYNRRGESLPYGGTASMAQRAAISAELARRLRRALGDTVPIFIRFSQWEAQDFKSIKFKTVDDLKQYIQLLTEAGVDGFDVSTRRILDPCGLEGASPEGVSLAGLTTRVLKELYPTTTTTGAPRPVVFGVGGVCVAAQFGEPPTNPLDRTYTVTDPTPAVDALAAGEYDLLGLGRIVLTNADFPKRLITGTWKDIKPFDAHDTERLN